MRVPMLLGMALLSVLSSAVVQAQAPNSGESLYQTRCMACHEKPDPMTRAPARAVLQMYTPEVIVNAMTNGKMVTQSMGLSEVDRNAIAEYLSGSKLGAASAAEQANQCKDNPALTDINKTPGWNGWGNGVGNTRYQPAEQGGITANNIAKLKLKWVFGYANVLGARTQPAYVGGRLFVASENGEVSALDPKTGCRYWKFKAQAGVRTALSVAPIKSAQARHAVYFGDSRANAYALDAQTGMQLWITKVDQHSAAAITGAPTVHAGRLYVPVQGLGEEIRGGSGTYECCTFRGSLSALDANTGRVIWKTYTIDEAKPRAKDKNGLQMWGPAGGSIWSAPTVDAKRGLIYAGTGNGYADPAQPNTDAVLAFDMKDGKIKWSRQVLSGDSWTLGCKERNPPENVACPPQMGPDFDFAAAPMLATVKGHDVIVIIQKSGMAYGFDPTNHGELLWERRVAQGSGLGGQWGGAIEGDRAFFGAGDFLEAVQGGMRGLDALNGTVLWSQPAQTKLCADVQGCNASQGGAVTTIPGAVLSSSTDGGIRAYSTADGAVLWVFNASREFTTVNGVRGHGGSMSGPGPIVANGMMFVNSGYGGLSGMPGNVLLAFVVE